MTANIYNDHAEENSLEHVLVSEVYPMKQLVLDQSGLVVPFTQLCGESVEYLGKTSEGVIALSNYRLFIDSFVNIPVGLIESVEYRDIFHLHVFSKDVRTIRCKFLTNDACLEWYKRLLQAIQPKYKLQDVFAFAFSAWYLDAQQNQELPDGLNIVTTNFKGDEGHLYTFGKEVERLQFDTHGAWRITLINEKLNICSSYPKFHLVPNSVTDKDIESIAGFRSSKRFPSVVWRDVRSGAVLARSSQPEVGWLGWRNTQDENFLQSVAVSCINNPGTAVSQKLSNGDVCQRETNNAPASFGVASASVPRNVLIIDARSYAAAVANRAKGGGCECADYYPNCEIMFMSLANIHAIRKSFLALRALCAMSPEQPGWLTNIETTKWLHHISGLLKSSLVVVNAIDKERRCVLVHCSDGWDRTPQIVALSELMLDPYYRTLEGFRVLVEKEWLEFGHKFADRCGQGLPTDDANERCPVFLQWLDCVHQLLQQFPCAFQFNEAFLVKLVQHTYSCLFGDFLCNTEKERLSERIYQRTISVWKLLCAPGSPFVNLLYRSASERDRILRPSYHIQSLRFWNSVYLSEMSSTTADEDLVEASESESSSSAEASPDVLIPAKTRSCEDLSKEASEEMYPNQMARRLSDPNLMREFPFDSASAETNRTLPLLSQDNADKDDGSEQLSSPKTSSCASEVNKCASIETLKAHEDEDHVAEAASKTSEQKQNSYVNGELENDSCYCDTLNNNSRRAFGIVSSSVETETAELKHAPSSFEDSSETLIGDLTELNQHPAGAAAETLISYSKYDKKYVSMLPTDNGSDFSELCDASARLLRVANTSNGVVATPDSLSAAAAKMTLEKCSSTSDLNSWQLSDRNRADLKFLMFTSVASNDGMTLQHFTVSTCPQSKLVTGVLTVDTSRSSPPQSNPLTGVGCSKELDLASSQAPSVYSSNPVTPNGESKYLTWGARQSGRLNRSQEFDGLTVYIDPVQQRVAQMRSDYEAQIRNLERQLSESKLMIKQVAEQTGVQFIIDNNRDEAASTDSGGERGSVGGGSAVASDVSWEQVEEKDAQMTLWVPDHVVTHCTGCDKEFWVALRKHHCRSCGHVFCDECSKYTIPVPQQQLLNPVRVCKKCFLSAKSISGDLIDQSSLEISRLTVGEAVSLHK